MEKLINKFIDLSKSVEYYYQLSLKDKIHLFNFCDHIGKLDLYANFMYEQISLNRLMFAISLEHSGKGQSVPSKKYLAEGKRINSFTYKNMTKHQYHIERKKVYKRIEEIKYLHSYKNNLNSYFLESSFYKDNHNLSEMVINELLRINEFIKKHKP